MCFEQRVLMRADIEVGLLAMLLLPATEVYAAEEGNTCSAVPSLPLHAASTVSSMPCTKGQGKRQIKEQEELTYTAFQQIGNCYKL